MAARPYTYGLSLPHNAAIKGLLLAVSAYAFLAVTSADVTASAITGAPAGQERSVDGAKANSNSGRPSQGDEEEDEGGQQRQDEHGDRSQRTGRDPGQSGNGPAEGPKATPVPPVAPPVPKTSPAGPVASSPQPPAPTPQALAQPAAIARPSSIPAGVGVAIDQAGAAVAVPAIVAPARPPIAALTPRDPERFSPPPVLAAVQPGVPAALAAALAALPLLSAIWIAAFLRIAAIIRRRLAANTYLALAAELGIAPVRLAGLLPRELALLREKVAFDELTGIMRRAGGLATLDREISRARRRRAPLSISFIDVDGLKSVNDARGHAAGDALLKDTADVLHGRLRAEDAVFRYGGDEFCCILPDADLAAARRIFDEALIAARARGGSFSVGLAQLSDDDDRASLLARADADLYRGRAERGNGGRA